MKKIFLFGLILLLLPFVKGDCICESRGDNFLVNVEDAPSDVEQGETFDIDVFIHNRGSSSGTMKVEAGMYTRDEVYSWYGGYSVWFNVPNCEPETNVQTKMVTIEDPDDFDILTYTITAGAKWDPDEDYVLHINAFENCHNCRCPMGTLQSNYDIDPIDLTGNNPPEPTCSDGIRNGLETSTDCGGPDCPPCGLDHKCEDDRDCISGYCLSGWCKERPSPDGGEPGPETKKKNKFVDLVVVGDEIIEVDENKLTVKTTLKNEGEDMVENWLLEMQPRPKGKAPLVFVGGQKTCDANHPENIHREFWINSGEQATIELNAFLGTGQYDIYLITVDKCWFDEPIGNEKFEPYGSGKKIGEVTISMEEGGSFVGPAEEEEIEILTFLIPLILIILGAVFATIVKQPWAYSISVVGIIWLLIMLF